MATLGNDSEALVFDSEKGLKGRPVRVVMHDDGTVDTPFGHKNIKVLDYGTEQDGAYVTPKAPLE